MNDLLPGALAGRFSGGVGDALRALHAAQGGAGVQLPALPAVHHRQLNAYPAFILNIYMFYFVKKFSMLMEVLEVSDNQKILLIHTINLKGSRSYLKTKTKIIFFVPLGNNLPFY